MRSLFYLLLMFGAVSVFAENNLDGKTFQAWGRVSCEDDQGREVSIGSFSDLLQGLVDGSKFHDRVKTVEGNHEALVIGFDKDTLNTLLIFSGFDIDEPSNGVDHVVMTRIQTISKFTLSSDMRINARYFKSRSISRTPDFNQGDITQWWDTLDKQLKAMPFTKSPETDLFGRVLSRAQVVRADQYGMSLRIQFDDKNPRDEIFSQICEPGTGSKALRLEFSAITEEQRRTRNVDR